MLSFLLRRLLWFGLTLLAVVTVTFVLMRQVKGGPFDGERSLHPAIERNLQARYHLDWPLWKQFLQYVGPVNLDRDGPRWLSKKDPSRRLLRVRGVAGAQHWEGEPAPIAPLQGVSAQRREELEAQVAQLEPENEAWTTLLAAQDEARQAQDHPATRLGQSPVLRAVFDSLYDTTQVSLEEGTTRATQLHAWLQACSELPGSPPAPDLNWAPSAQDPIRARTRAWFAWYYRDGGQTLWNSGLRPWTGLLIGDFGPSLRYRDYSVREILAESLPISLRLGVLALTWAIALGVTAGLASALLRGGSLDVLIRLTATLGIAIPNFIIALVLILVFAFWQPWFPSAGWSSLRHMVLPSLALGAPFAAYIARLTRTGLLEVLGADYIRTARAKGLSPLRIVLRHALKGGMLPTISYLGPATAGILTGSLVIERIFFIPGTGSHFVNSALSRDYTLALGVTILYTILVYSLNTVVDLVYLALDPRIDYE